VNDRQIQTEKELLRAWLRRLPASAWPDPAAAGKAIAKRFEELAILRPQSGVAGFMACGREPDLTGWLAAWLAAGGDVYLPVFDQTTGVYSLAAVTDLSTQLVIGQYAIREPLPELPKIHPPYHKELVHAWLIPGVAFTRDGRRLGRGAGFYDRLLAGANGTKIGVANDCQIVDAMPTAQHDIRMDMLVTESQLIVCE